jgi:hypothetical protein
VVLEGDAADLYGIGFCFHAYDAVQIRSLFHERG